MRKALAWSYAANRAVDAMPESEKQPFPGVRETLETLHRAVDVAVVSSANPDALQAEWQAHGLLVQVDLLLSQNDGSKAACIACLRQKGYQPQHILMVGDASGDLAAAEEKGVLFYPIPVDREVEAWQGL